MSEKPKFFFEEDPQADAESSLTSAEHSDMFFNTLKEVANVQEHQGNELEEKQFSSLAAMKKMESKVLTMEYGTYEDNYAIHVTPIHPTVNLKTEKMVEAAMKAMVVEMNTYVPYDLQVNLWFPRPDWKLKVLSAVVEGGATAWNFDRQKLEDEGIPKIFKQIETLILGKPGENKASWRR